MSFFLNLKFHHISKFEIRIQKENKVSNSMDCTTKLTIGLNLVAIVYCIYQSDLEHRKKRIEDTSKFEVRNEF